jgi:hypothetical protein
MSAIVITDPQLLAQLASVSGTVELRDAAGTLVGQFQQRNPGALPPGVKSPISDEELERRRKNLTGKPLSEIIKRLESGDR